MQMTQDELLDRVKAASKAQFDAGLDLLGLCLAARKAGMPWKPLAEATGMPMTTLIRQVLAGSPVAVFKPFNKSHERRPGKNLA